MEKRGKKMEKTIISYFSGLQFRTHGHVKDYPSCLDGMRFAGYFGIQYTNSGRVEYAIDGEEKKIYDGPCAFVSMPGHVFHYGAPAGETREHAYLCFSGPRVLRYRRTGLLPCSGKMIRIVRNERFLSTMLETEKMLSESMNGVPPRAVLLLEDLLLQLHEQPDPAKRAAPFCENRIRRLMEEVRIAPARQWNFEREAENLSISAAHFRRVFRETAGIPPGRFLIESRLEKAAALLRETVLSVGETARLCGFEDVYYFSRMFRLHRGITAHAYRKEFRT